MNEELFKSAVVIAAPMLVHAAQSSAAPLPSDAIQRYVLHAYQQLEQAQEKLRQQKTATPPAG